jgi:hypothetical protein
MALDIIQRKSNVIMNPDVIMSTVKFLGSSECGVEHFGSISGRETS